MKPGHPESVVSGGCLRSHLPYLLAGWEVLEFPWIIWLSTTWEHGDQASCNSRGSIYSLLPMHSWDTHLSELVSLYREWIWAGGLEAWGQTGPQTVEISVSIKSPLVDLWHFTRPGSLQSESLRRRPLQHSSAFLLHFPLPSSASSVN